MTWGAFMAEKKTHEMFISELAHLQPKIEVVGKYIGARTHIKVHCKVCGHEWDAMPTNLLKGRNCPICSYKNRGERRSVSKVDFISRLEAINPDVEIIGEYTNAGTKVLARCKRCGNEWLVLPQSLLKGNRCPRCSHTGTSFVEQVIYLSLQRMMDTEILSRVRSIIDRELDIYIPSKHFAVEYGAWFWHKDKEEADVEKIRQCSEKGIKLIEIFDAYDGEDESTKNIWLYRENIGRIANIHIVKEIIIRLCNEINLPYTLSDEEFESIQYQARMNSRRITTEILNEKLNGIQANIIVTGEYQDMLKKVHARCLSCGHEWEVIPASLLRGLGCPECGVKHRSALMRKTKEQFVTELNQRNPIIEVLGEYAGNHTPLLVRCKKHDYIWTCQPNSLLRGVGCPKCKDEKIAKALTKPIELFSRQLADINPNIEIVGNYKNNSTKVKVRCKLCSYEWDVLPYSLLAGNGCPKCGRQTQADKRRKSNEQFLSELKRINSDIVPLESYQSSKSKMKVMCSKCLKTWESTPSSLLHGNGCPYCAGNHRKTHEMFIDEMNKKHPTIEVIGTYKNAKAKVSVKCKECGYEWEDNPSNLLSLGRGCRQCRIKPRT